MLPRADSSSEAKCELPGVRNIGIELAVVGQESIWIESLGIGVTCLVVQNGPRDILNISIAAASESKEIEQTRHSQRSPTLLAGCSPCIHHPLSVDVE